MGMGCASAMVAIGGTGSIGVTVVFGRVGAGHENPRRRGTAGVWELFVPRLAAGARYKYAIVGADGMALPDKADPVARQAEPAAQPQVLAALDRVDPAALDTAGKIDLVRAYQLALVRLGDPSSLRRFEAGREVSS